MTPIDSPNRRALVLLLMVAGLWTTPAVAAPRARLSADLAGHLAAGSQTIDVIVDGDRGTVDALARRHNLVVKRYLKSSAVLRVTAGQLAALAEDDTLDHLSSDLPVRSSLVTAALTIGADRVWAGAGDLKPVSGEGVGVAVIDSGVDVRHGALRGRVVFTKDFTGGDGSDQYGHGTHVAALIAGEGGGTPDTRDYRGIAAGARIINLRVLDGRGAGLASDVIEAIDWAIDNRKAFDIRVINLSLGAPVLQSYRDDPLCEAVERAIAAGIVVVAAAGNYGVTSDGRLVFGSITSPANDPGVIAVGALDGHGTSVRSDDSVARYSSKGPSMYDVVMKPDLVAPGNRVVSAEAAGSYLATTYPQRHVAGVGANAFIQLSGTSMSAAVVSGAVALLLDARSNLSPYEVRILLQMTASLMPSEGLLTSGTGSLNVLAAVDFARNPRRALIVSEISGEEVRIGGLVFLAGDDQAHGRGRGGPVGRLLQNPSAHSELATPATGSTIVWGGTIIWGNTIIWGSSATGATIVWGSSSGETIVWGNSGDTDTIVWGSASDGETIVWGSNLDNDRIVWGNALDSDTIVWGSYWRGDTIIWGSLSL